MNLSIDRAALLEAATAVSGAVASKTTNPVLACLKITCLDDSLTLVARDAETVGVRRELRGVSVDRPGSAVVPTKLLACLKESDAESVTLKIDGDILRVTVGTSRYELPTFPVDGFPDLPEWDESQPHATLTAGVVRTLIRRTAFAADKKDAGGRFALTGVRWEFGEKGGKPTVTLVATDTKRLAVAESPCEVSGDAMPAALVPLKAITLLERNLGDDGEPVSVSLRENDALFQTGRVLLYTRLVSGRYPPHGDILAQCGKGNRFTLALPREGFARVVRQACIMTDDESRRIDFAFTPGKVSLSARGAATGSADVEMDLPDFEGTVDTAADPKYLLELLGAYDAESVELRMAAGDKPLLFAGDGGVTLVMPLAG